jgi:hypothetical protein
VEQLIGQTLGTASVISISDEAHADALSICLAKLALSRSPKNARDWTSTHETGPAVVLLAC